MAKKQAKGKCKFCGAEYTRGGMSKHLKSCIEKNADPKGKKKKFFHIVVQGAYDSEYWLHLAVLTSTKLSTLDHFLRDIWLECCGHMSAFNIAGQSYSEAPMGEFGDESMNVKMSAILKPGMQFGHEYDFGSTTELVLKVVSEFEVALKGKSIQILSRNEPPDIPCEECGKPATQVCTECLWNGEGWLCDDCIEDHECGEEMALPVVNSPRVGVCGYCG